MESILTSVKQIAGLTEGYDVFNAEIIMYINNCLFSLNDFGLGPDRPAIITSDVETWQGIFGDIDEIEAIKTYISTKVKLAFDPPSNSALLEAYKRNIDELEWRLTNHKINKGE